MGLRPNIADEVRRRRRVAIDVAVKAGHTLQAGGFLRLSVGRGVELLLRELRYQQAQALKVFCIENTSEDLLEVFNGNELSLRNIAQIESRSKEDRRWE